MIRENQFQAELIRELKQMFTGCVIQKLDSSYTQGIPDLLILYGSRWAVLEVKRSKSANHQPNQDYYVDLLDHMSFSRFIYPENKNEVLEDLQRYFM